MLCPTGDVLPPPPNTLLSSAPERPSGERRLSEGHKMNPERPAPGFGLELTAAARHLAIA